MSENVYVVEAKRTTFGSFGGMLADVEAPKLAATVIRELHKRSLRYGLATLCIGGGEAVAVIFERL